MNSLRLFFIFVVVSVTASGGGKTRNVILVTIDGLRWQEVFRGANETFMSADRSEGGGVPSGEYTALKTDFLAPTIEERRKKLMPFFWSTVVPQGQAFGNRDVGSIARVLNAERVSYAGYNELLTGTPDPLITTNTPLPNPNVTVLEWLNGRPEFHRRVAGAAAWNVFVPILNIGRSRLPLFVTQQKSSPGSVSPRIAEIERWMADIPPITRAENFDAFVYHAAIDMIDTHQPRVFLLALGEPDEWAHVRRYDRYLYSIQRCDRFIRQLWEKLQADPLYRDTTSLVITPDHGRGLTPKDWTNHGKNIPGSDETWLAVLGPDTPPRGERRDAEPVTQAQVAATVAALLGETQFAQAFPNAAPSVSGILLQR